MSDTEEEPTSGRSVTVPAHTAKGAVNIKIPPFWPSDPQIWFAQVEAQFSTRGITSERTKFDHIIASLAPEYAQEVRDLLLSPPTSSPYTTLKTKLIERTAASEQRRLQQLFHAEELGDRKPTQLLRRMQQLMGEQSSGLPDNSFLRQLFLQRLPSNVRMVSTGTTELQDLAQLADKIMEVAVPTTVSGVRSSTSTNSTDIDHLKSEIAELRQLFQSFLSVNKSSHGLRSRSRARGRSPTPVRSPTDEPTVCWYHERFGNSAKKCRSPCSFQSTGNDQASR